VKPRVCTTSYIYLTSIPSAFTFPLLLKLVRASSSPEEDREAGATPALPRNCKRGHDTGSLELLLWEGPMQESDEGEVTG
jgi:hypothetical protein